LLKSIFSAALITGITLAVLIPPAGAQNEAAAFLSASEIMHRADSVSTYQDTLLAHTKFKAREEVIFNEIGGKGEIKNSDTVISLITMEGKREISRQIVYSSRKKEGEKQGESQEAGMEFSYSNPDYNYSLTETNATSYVIAVSPKAEPKKGDVRGTISIDRQGFFTRALNLEVPKPEGALKEFATQISFEPLEGGLVVMREMKMKGFAKALLGIFKMRFSGEIRYSDYEILK